MKAIRQEFFRIHPPSLIHIAVQNLCMPPSCQSQRKASHFSKCNLLPVWGPLPRDLAQFYIPAVCLLASSSTYKQKHQNTSMRHRLELPLFCILWAIYWIYFPKSVSFSPILIWAFTTLTSTSLNFNLIIADYFQLVTLHSFSISGNKATISLVSKHKKSQFSSKSLLLSFHINISKYFTASNPQRYLFFIF